MKVIKSLYISLFWIFAFYGIWSFSCTFLGIKPKPKPSTPLLQQLTPQKLPDLRPMSFVEIGWFPKHNKQVLQTFFLKNEIKEVVELRPTIGKSTRFLAGLLPENGVLYAISLWEDQAESRKATAIQKTNANFRQFLSNMYHSGSSNKVIPIRMESIEAAQSFRFSADLVYIETPSNKHTVYYDIINWYQHLNNKGIICGDDWLYHEVREGIKEACEILGVQAKSDGNFWWIEHSQL